MSDLVLYDTVIVGAGAAGLTAAYELVRRGQTNVQILEASPLWGGRVRKANDTFADFPIDIGGSWIHENEDSSPNSRVLKTIVNNPNASVTAKTAVDDRTFQYYEDGNWVECPPVGDGGTKVLDEIFVNSSWYSFFETYIYPTAKNYITYNCAVDLIDYTADESVYLECINGKAMRAKKVIVTASVEVLRTGVITFMPPLPQETTDILESYAFKRVLKGYIRFSDQFYDDGKSFEIYPPFYGEDNGDFLFWDAAFKQGSAHNVLGVLITDKYLDDFASLSEAQILSKLLDHLDLVYGGRANASYMKHVVKDWTKEPYILGGWSVTNFDSSQYRSDLWTLLQPLGNGKVYLAGEAIPHDEWSSTIPAAALSGQTAACRAMGGMFSNLDTDCTFQQMPSSSAGFMTGGNPTICFAGDATVELINNTRKTMMELKIGDMIKVGEGKYEPVYTFGHRDPDLKNGQYLLIYMKGTYDPLPISRDHMVFIREGRISRSVPASMLKVGDSLMTASSADRAVSIKSIDLVTRSGAFAPFTLSGKIVVNGIQASNYISLQESTDKLVVGGFTTPFSYQWLAHAFQAPHRILFRCGLVLVTGSDDEIFSKTGISPWVDMPHKAFLWLLGQNPLLIVAVLIPVLVSFVVFAFLDAVMTSYGIGWWLVGAGILSITLKIGKEKKGGQ